MKSLMTAAAILALMWGEVCPAHAGEGKGVGLQAAAAVPTAAAPAPLRCAAFSPYVNGYDPNVGPHPPASLIARLLDKLVAQTRFRCIMTYGVLHGLDATFPAAKQRGIKVIANCWLDNDTAVNTASIAACIRSAKAYPDTIIRLSCGSEVRTRHGAALDSEITRCIAALRAARVVQPITTIDTWWEWCNRPLTKPIYCRKMVFADKVDWIGINVFPWWENRDSGIFPCTPAWQAPSFHINRLRDVKAAYPRKDVMITEFGWPAGPPGYRETNRFTGQKCGIAGEAAQTNVINGTIAKLDAQQPPWSGVVFEAFREPWKSSVEGPVGPYWGICKGVAPYACKAVYSPSQPTTEGSP